MASNNKTLEAILAQTQSLVKSAAERTRKTASNDRPGGNITGTDPATLPGAEHDSTTPSEFKQPDKETKDETMVPNSGLSIEGAGDDSPLTRGHALEVDEPVLTPDKKPLETADAEAKEASTGGLCNEILGMIHSYNKQASAKPVAKKAGDSNVAKKENVAGDKAPTVVAKEAGGLDMELTQEVMAKIAAVLLSTEEGANVVGDYLAKTAGAEAADDMLTFLAGQNELAEKAAAFEDGMKTADDLIVQHAYEAGRNDERMIKGATSSQTAGERVLAAYANRFHKQGQDAAEGAIEDLMAQGGGSQDVSPEELEALAGGGMGDMGGMGDVNDEELQALIEESGLGDMSEEELVEIAEALEGMSPEEIQSLTEGDMGDASGGDAELEALIEESGLGDMSEEEVVEIISALEELGPEGIEELSAGGDMGGGGDSIGEGDITDGLKELVESGEIQPEEADEIYQELSQGGGGAAPMPEEEMKMANARNLLAAVRQHARRK